MSATLFYLWCFLLLSGGIGWVLRWPARQKNLGLAVGGIALLLATWLGWQLTGAPASGFLLQPPPASGIPWLQPAIDLFWAALQFLVEALQQASQTLLGALPFSINLALILAFLALYLAVKLLLVGVAWIVHGLVEGWGGLRRRWRRWRGEAVTPLGAEANRRDALPASADFLKATARWGLLALAVALGLLPYWMTLDPVLDAYFNGLFWAGAWIALLECWQWLRVRGVAAPPLMDVDGADVSAVADAPLDKVYRDYLQLHNDRDIGDRALLFYCDIEPPHFNSAQPASRLHEEDEARNGDIAHQLQHRLETYLPGGLLEEMLHLANLYERGDNLLFTETLCGYHFLLLAEFVQHRKNRGQLTLLICPYAATAQVEAALQQQVELHQLRLTHRWAVLGRDVVTAATQLDVLICPDNALETHLFRHLHTLTPVLQRLRLLICLDIQALRLSALRLALGRLWLSVSQRQVQIITQAEPYCDMETQVRHVLSFADLRECRLNPQLAARRYLLVWDNHSPRHRQLSQHYFRGYQGALELNQLLLLAPWKHRFEVVHLDPESRHDEDALEHLNNELLVHYGHQALRRHGRRYQPVGHVYAAGDELVYQFEDLYNLPLALDRNSNFSGSRSSLLNVICGNYLLRDYYRACLYGAGDPHKLLRNLRPLTVHPRGTLSEVVTALCDALKYGHDGRGLTRAEIEEQFLNLAPTGWSPKFTLRADWVNLQDLFKKTLAYPPYLTVRQEGDGRPPRYSIAPESRIGGPRYYSVCNEAGQEIGVLDAEDYGLSYALNQLLLVGGKFYNIREIRAETEEKTKVLARHQESEERNLRRGYRFERGYRFLPDRERYTEGEPISRVLAGNLRVEIRHWHADFEGVSRGYWELTEALRPLTAGIPPQWPLDPPLRRTHRLQNVGHLRARQAALVGDRDLATVAFTLCAVMQDCLVSLFPQHYWKLAIVSPQSSRLDPEQDEVVRFYHQLYPVLEEDGEPSSASGQAAGAQEVQIDWYIFEDADHDLGVIRALCSLEGHRALLGLSRDYLAWALEQPSEEHLYQAYGGSGLPGCLDYAGALAVLDKLLPNWRSPVVAPLDRFDCGGGAVPEPRTEEACDFCGVSLEGVRETLPDGRRRCLPCGRDAIDTVQEFRWVLEEVIGNMNRRYRISLPEDIQVRFVDAREIARQQGKTFIPSAGFDPRAVGLAIKSGRGGKTMLLENGAPRLSTQATLAHELTHLWQFALCENVGALSQEIAEGQARYAEIDYLWAFGGELLAARLQREMEVGNDVYAVGYRWVAERCPREAGRIFEHFAGMLGER